MMLDSLASVIFYIFRGSNKIILPTFAVLTDFVGQIFNILILLDKLMDAETWDFGILTPVNLLLQK